MPSGPAGFAFIARAQSLSDTNVHPRTYVAVVRLSTQRRLGGVVKTRSSLETDPKGIDRFSARPSPPLSSSFLLPSLSLHRLRLAFYDLFTTQASFLFSSLHSFPSLSSQAPTLSALSQLAHPRRLSQLPRCGSRDVGPSPQIGHPPSRCQCPSHSTTHIRYTRSINPDSTLSTALHLEDRTSVSATLPNT